MLLNNALNLLIRKVRATVIDPREPMTYLVRYPVNGDYYQVSVLRVPDEISENLRGPASSN